MEGHATSFLPILLYSGVMIAFVVTNLILTQTLGPKHNTVVKNMPYESGMDPVGDARQPFDVKFYVVAILFLVFDVELLLLYPWACSAYVPEAEGGVSEALGGPVFAVMMVFLATLAVAYVYAWKRGVFRWR